MRAGTRKAELEEEPCSAIELPGDFEEYLAGLRSKFRRSYRQRTNKLLRTCEVRFLRTESEAELPAHLDTLFRLHQRRWTEADRVGAFADARMRRFYDDVSRRLLRSGSLRFWHLEADGAIRASQYGFAYDGVLHSLQEAYDMDFSAPGVGGLGVVLRGHVLRSAIEEGLRSYDFLGGAQDHKLRWGASIHRIRHLTVARAGVAARAGWLQTAGAAAIRDSIKTALPEPVLERLRATRAAYRRRRTRAG
jgi:CelD/BcsL family acetyltransferase involved in cellulose biosynthesis